MQVASLAIYPVKGLRAIPLTEAAVEWQGLTNDRRWAIARPDGRAFTQRDLPGMARISTALDGAALRLERAGQGGTTAIAGSDPAVLVVWGTRIPVLRANPEASAWVSRVLGAECTLVYQADPASRPVAPQPGMPGRVVNLADGFPLLVTTEASLDDLNRRLAQPVPMDRFRPNLVVAGAPAWAEDGWSTILAGPVRLRLASACSRCVVTTLDQQTGEKPARTEPLRTLGTFHRDADGQITFGRNAIPEELGTVSVGAAVSVVAPGHDGLNEL